jgi:hypothetical protein
MGKNELCRIRDYWWIVGKCSPCLFLAASHELLKTDCKGKRRSFGRCGDLAIWRLLAMSH